MYTCMYICMSLSNKIMIIYANLYIYVCIYVSISLSDRVVRGHSCGGMISYVGE